MVVSGINSSPTCSISFNRLDESAWQEQPDGSACAELPFVSAMAAAAKTDHVFRYVVVRRPLEGTLGVMDDQLPARDGEPAREIHAYLTNIPAPDDGQAGSGHEPMTARAIIDWARDRCGRGEEVHAVLKRDMAAGILPSGRIGRQWCLAGHGRAGDEPDRAAAPLGAWRKLALAAHEEPSGQYPADTRSDLHACGPDPGAGPHTSDPRGPRTARRHSTTSLTASCIDSPRAVRRS